MHAILPNVSFNITRVGKIESDFLPTGGIKRDESAFYELLFMEKGQAIVKTNDYEGVLDNMQMILVAPGSPLEISYEGDAKPMVLQMYFKCDNQRLKIFVSSPIIIPISMQTHLHRALKEYTFVCPPKKSAFKPEQTIINPEIPYGAEQLLFYDIEYFFIMLIRKATIKIDYAETPKRLTHHQGELLHSLTDYIEKHITEQITNFGLCEQFGINKTTLCKIFKENYDTTLIKYVNLSKIQMAKSLIRDGEMNFTQIADYLSFSSIHYFCKTFKKIEGMSPTRYMKMVTHHQQSKVK